MSSKSVAEKLKIKPGTTVWSSNASGFDLIGPLPSGARRTDDLADDVWSALQFRANRGGEGRFTGGR